MLGRCSFAGWTLSLLVAAASGCGSDGSYRLHIVFPDEDARQSVDEVVLWALGPEGQTCRRLMEGSVSVADLKYHSKLTIPFPAGEADEKLPRVPTGEIVFFAEGRAGPRAVLLRGCETVEVKAGRVVDVVLQLVWVCELDPDGGIPEEVPNNEIDDDCDGLTDECTVDEDCDDGDGCTADFCIQMQCEYLGIPDGFNCDDGNPCTTGDTCQSGNCSGQTRDCSAFDGQCVNGACNSETGDCGSIPKPDGETCDDGAYCTVDDSCQAGVCTGTDMDCDDGDECTRDECSEGDDRCDNILEPRPGEEGLSNGDTCSNLTDDDCDGFIDDQDPNCRGCTGDSECNDSNPCTLDICTDQVCVNEPFVDGSPCDDGSYCTAGDQCVGGVCESVPRDCSDESDACHDGICVEDEDRCVGQPKANGTACDDGLYCTVGDSCQLGACAGGALDCEDNDICTQDSCNESADRCDNINQPNPGAEGPPGDLTCFNNADDDCDGSTDLDDGNCYDCTGAPDCDDNNQCTNDDCVQGVCENVPEPDGTGCDDGELCTQDDGCLSGVCAGTTYSCDDGNECTDGACLGDGNCDQAPVPDGTWCGDPSDTQCDSPDSCASGACRANHQPAGTACDDGLYCNGADTCDGSGSCGVHGGDPCGAEQCDEIRDTCRDPSLSETIIHAADSSEDARFGSGVSISGDTAIIGASGDNQLTGAVYILHFDGANWIQQAKLTAPDGMPNDYFGTEVSISGDLVVIGADGNDDNGSSSGSAYTYHFNGTDWQFGALLDNSAGDDYDYFGQSVSVSGDTIVVGVRYDNERGSSAGAAFVYYFDGTDLVEQAKLTASDAAAHDEFGVRVAIWGDTIVVGAQNADGTGAAYIYQFDGTTWVEQAKLVPSDGVADDEFGVGVAIFADTAVVSSIGDDDRGENSGSVYVYHFNGSNWVEQAKLTASDGAADDWFGRFVSIFGDTLVVGAPFHDANGEDSGAAYVYHFNGTDWVERYKIEAGDGVNGDNFGKCVSVSGETVLVGAKFNDGGASNGGSAYFYEMSPKPLEAKLTAGDGAADDYFGVSVSLSGDTAVVGAYRDDDDGESSGSVYVYNFDGTDWVEQAKLTASDAAANDWFGWEVGVSGDTAIVGSPHDSVFGTDSGSAYVFHFDGTGWVEQTTLFASDAEGWDVFGWSVAVSGDAAIVGAQGEGVAGAAYIFRYDGTAWFQQAKLTASDGSANDCFGTAVSISEDTAIVGSEEDDDNGNNAGAAYIFHFDGTNWIEQQKLTAGDGTAGDFFGSNVAIFCDTAVVGAYLHNGAANGSGAAYVYRFTESGWQQQAKLTASDAAADDGFGRVVSVFGDEIVVSAPYSDGSGANSGSIYIFHFDGSTWQEKRKLTASDAAAGDRFGRSVSVSGDMVISGAHYDESNSGSAYVLDLR